MHRVISCSVWAARRLPWRAAGLLLLPVFAAVAQSGDRVNAVPAPVLTSPPRAAMAASATAPDLSRIRTPAEATRLLRDLWALQDFNTAADAGAVLAKRFPGNAQVTAWWAVNLRRTAHGDRADSIAATLDSTGRDPLVTGLATWVRLYGMSTGTAEKRRLVARLGEATRRTANVDLAWMLQEGSNRLNSSNYAKAATVADSIAKAFGEPPVLRATALQGQYYAIRFGERARDTAAANGLVRELVALVQREPTDLRLLQIATDVASYAERPELELQFTTMMMARSPRSNAIRSEYWSAVNSVRGLTAAERASLVDLDRRYYLAMVDSTPWALSSVLSSVRRTHKGSPDIAVLERAIETRAPRTPFHERILEQRVSRWADSLQLARDTSRAGPRPDSTVARRQYLEQAEAFMQKGWTAEQSLSTSMALRMYIELSLDSASSTPAIVRAAQRLLAHERLNGPWLVRAARSLADRGVALSTADSLTRRGEAISLEQILSFPSMSIGEQAEAMDNVKADAQDALGWSAFKAGRLADADAHFKKGLELSKRDPNLYLHLGRMRQAQGKPDEAELAWAEGMTVKARGVNPNRRELETLYKSKHGSLDGWAPYVAALEEKERTVRKARILAKREAKPTTLPALTDVLLSGDSVSTAALSGKTLVVHFWGTWCGPCIAEMPELQQFSDKYRADSAVRLITIANDEDRDVLVKWLADRKHTIPTVWNKPYTTASGISAWPTTWFIAPDGRLTYQMIGNAGQLVEEWSWIVEALKGPR